MLLCEYGVNFKNLFRKLFMKRYITLSEKLGGTRDSTEAAPHMSVYTRQGHSALEVLPFHWLPDGGGGESAEYDSPLSLKPLQRGMTVTLITFTEVACILIAVQIPALKKRAMTTPMHLAQLT